MNREQYTMIDLAVIEDKKWYQKLVDFIRCRNSRFPEITGQWPGSQEGSLAASRYPNLAAELATLGFTVYIGNVAKAAGVRTQTIASAIERGASLRPYQLERLAAVLRVSVEYLSNPYLAIVDSSTVTGANQIARFGFLLEDTKGLAVPLINGIRADYNGLGTGGFITYAAYKAAIRILLTAKHHPVSNGRKPRSENTVLRIDGHTSSWEVIEA